MKIDRLLSIIVYLMNHELINARVLAERFGVTVRTIQRDMETIELAGIPIMSIQGPSGGYGIMENFKIDSRLVSVEDLYYIITSLKSVADTMEGEQIDLTLNKMESLLRRICEKAKPNRRDRNSRFVSPIRSLFSDIGRRVLSYPTVRLSQSWNLFMSKRN